LDGKATELGKFLAEELITKLFLTKKFEVIERQLLNKIIAEHKLDFSGLIDPNSAKELGKILGADAIVSGTITDLVENIKVNARLISTETGQIFSVASEDIIKDNTVKKLMGQYSYNGSNRLETQKSISNIFFKEDFSEYQIGDIASDWGANIVVLKSTSGDNCIKNQSGTTTITHDIRFPSDFSFEYDFWGYTGWGENLILVDSEGKELLIKINAAPYLDFIVLGGIKSNGLKSGAESLSNERGWNTLKIIKIGSVVKVYLNSVFAVSGSFSGFSNFVNIKYTASEGRCLKNFLGTTIN